MKYFHIISFFERLKLLSVILEKHSVCYWDDKFMLRVFIGTYGGISALCGNYYLNYDRSLFICNFRKRLGRKNINIMHIAVDVKLNRILPLSLLESILLEDLRSTKKRDHCTPIHSRYQLVRVKNCEANNSIFLYKTGNYFHFYIETMTQVLKNINAKINVYFLIGDQPFYHSILGFYKIKYQNSAIIPEGSNDFNMPRIYPFSLDIIWLHKYNSTNWVLGKDEKYRIFITRRRENGRRILNEDALIKMLRAHGFIVFDPSNYDFQQQAEYFRNAEVIVAPHGAALSNIVWCSSDVKIIELNGNINVRWHFSKIALFLNYNYILLIGNTLDANYFEIDIDLVKKHLLKAIQ